MDIILFSTADWDNPFWTNKQHIATRLADRGYRILYIESLGLRRPTGNKKDLKRIISKFRKGLRGIKKVKKNVWVYSPLVIPAHGNPQIDLINKKILIKSIQKYLKALGFLNPVLWTYNPLTIELTGNFNESLIIYHCVDDLPAAPGMPVDALIRAEKNLVRKADLVFTTHPKLQETRSRWNPENTVYLSNVADYEHFSKAQLPGPVPDDLAVIPRPRIGFIGAISDYKLDFDLISYLARKRSDWHWVFIGRVGEGQPNTIIRKLNLPNIHLLGPKEYISLPAYLRGFDIATIPSKLNDYTASMFPIKFFEYLSSGKPVVATSMPALQSYSNACRLTSSHDGFMSAIEDVLAGKTPDKNYCLALAKKNTWELRIEQMLELIQSKLEHKSREAGEKT